jgi:hypothetical protein
MTKDHRLKGALANIERRAQAGGNAFNEFWPAERLVDFKASRTMYQRANHQLYFRFISASQPVIYGPAPVLPVGTLLPGDLGTGMGPYKRPGQVFGERDPVSPYLTSRAAAVPPLLSLPSKAPAAVPPPQSLQGPAYAAASW